MSSGNLPANPVVRVTAQRLSAHRRVACLLLLTVLAGLLAACRDSPPATGSFTPPYLRLRLCGGEAQSQWPGSSEWIEMGGEVIVKDVIRVIAGEMDGARFCLGDGSMLELAPGVEVEARNPHVFPRLQVMLQDGSLLFEAQGPSYEFVLPACSVTFLSVPSRLWIEVSDQTTHLMVEEGAVNCALETETLTLFTCREMYAGPGEEPRVTDFCVGDATPATLEWTPLPRPTRR
ncbi:MAG TPA: hypothetical protein ENI37_03325 [Chloroflexi bacterium]|nr:hypothetical protein [Chloroflexota bacterium]